MRVFDVYDPNELGAESSVTRRFPRDKTVHQYRLREPSLLRQRFDTPISRMATSTIGDLGISYVEDRFGTEAGIGGDGVNRFCFNIMLSGAMTFASNGPEIVAADRIGLVYRGLPGTRLLTSDANRRLNLWLDGAKLESALAARLDDHLRHALRFCPTVDWAVGIAASLQAQIGYIVRELARPDGIASNPVARASLGDLLRQMVLSAVPHNYSDRLSDPRRGAVPTYVYRAEDFMRAHAATALRLEEIALAAGCSVRALSQAYRTFRGITPLAALHAIRLDHVRAELQRSGGEVSTSVIARRYGFTNPARFAAAYRERFRETLAQTARR